MTGIENAQHDLSDAQFSLETAIELLNSINADGSAREAGLNNVIQHLLSIKSELADSFAQLQSVQTQIEH